MPAPRTTVCLLLCLSFVPTAWAARLAMEQTEGDSQRAFVLHEGGNMHTDQAALRERRAAPERTRSNSRKPSTN